MMILLILCLILTFVFDVTTQGVCTRPDLSINLMTTIYGTKDRGFSIKCEYGFTGSYGLVLWSIEKDPGGTPDIVYSYFTGVSPPSSKPGSNYQNREIKFENTNTVVLGSMYSNDTGTYKCTVQFNVTSSQCTESSFLNLNAKPVISFERSCLQRHTEETLIVTGTDFLSSAQTSPNFILELNGENNTLQTTIVDQSDGFQMFTSNITKSFSTKIVQTRLFMVVGDSSSTVEISDFKTELDPTPFLVISVILVVLEVTVTIVLIVFGANWGKVVRWIVFISSIVVIVFGVIFVILLPVEACKPLKAAGIVAVVFSVVDILLGVVGLVLVFMWKSQNNNWILCK